jgi:hypothetical protein
MSKEMTMPEPTYLFGQEEAAELAKIENVIEAKGPIPFSYSNIKKAKEIVLKYRKLNDLGTMISIMPNPKLGKMKNLEYHLPNMKCPYQSIYFGRYMGMRNENHLWTPVSITSIPRTLNLEIDADLADWMVIRLFRHLKGSFYNEKTGDKQLFYVKDERAEMIGGFTNAELIVSAIDKVKDLSSEMLLMAARQLGMSLSPGTEKHIGHKEVLGFVLQKAIDNAKEVIDIISNASASINATLASAIFSGIIFVDHNGFTYKGRLLGRTKEEVVTALQVDSKTYQLISVQAKTADSLAIKIEKEISDSNTILPDEEDKTSKF